MCKQNKIRNSFATSFLAGRYPATSWKAVYVIVLWEDEWHSYVWPIKAITGLLWPVKVSCPIYEPSQLLSTSLLTEGPKHEKEKALALCKHSSAIAKTLVCCEHCFIHESKAHHCMGYYEESYSHPHIHPVQ